MRKILLLTVSAGCLLAPAVSSALEVYGKLYQERYTFFLTEQGGNALMQVNNKMAGLKGPVDINAVQNEGYSRTGIAPYYNSNPQNRALRDDGKPVKAVTCVMTAVPAINGKMDRTWCVDEVGAEYIGFKGWPVQDAVARACRVGDNDCPVYLSLQGDDPRVRNDSVRFRSARTAKETGGNGGTDDLKSQGCALANESLRLGGETDTCKAITRIESVSPRNQRASFTTVSGQEGVLEISEDAPTGNMRTRSVTARPGGTFYSQSWKEGKWVCTGEGGRCH